MNFKNFSKNELKKLKQWLEFAASQKDYEDEELNQVIVTLSQMQNQ